jgi:hypothetical protein
LTFRLSALILSISSGGMAVFFATFAADKPTFKYLLITTGIGWPISKTWLSGS